ncbi:MAG: hypothetical protein ACOH2T_29440 [Pseudomonas sp.]
MNLIEQQNVLKGLTDENLQMELAQPSGSAPPFLIATEVSRRKSARDRYEGEQARQGKRSTVMEDLMGPGAPQPMMTGGVPMQPQQAQQPQAMPMQGAQPQGIAAFADGGLVDSGGGLDYSAISRKYADSLVARPDREKRARAMALISAGAGIMGGGSSNFFTNIGRGITPAVQQYGTALDNIDTEERQTLRDAMDLERTQNSEELQRLQYDTGRTDSDRNYALAADRATADNDPASIRTTRAYMAMTPEEQAVYDAQNPAYNPNQVTNDMRITESANKIYDNALKALPDPSFVKPGEEASIAADRQRQAAVLAYPQWVNLMGAERAKQFAAQYGLTDGDILTGGGGAGGLQGGDPLGLGL